MSKYRAVLVYKGAFKVLTMNHLPDRIVIPQSRPISFVYPSSPSDEPVFDELIFTRCTRLDEFGWLYRIGGPYKVRTEHAPPPQPLVDFTKAYLKDLASASLKTEALPAPDAKGERDE